MASNSENRFLPDNFVEFFSSNRTLAVRKIEDLLIDSANNVLNSITSRKISNVVLFEFMENIKDDLLDLWHENVLTEIELSYKVEFKKGISNKALELSIKNFQKGLDKAYDQITKQVLRWSLDLTSDDFFKLSHLIIQNLKSTIRKSILIIQDNTLPPANMNL
jgi:hypothetical protein